MFIKRAKSRPSLRAREADDEPAAGSPLAKSSVTASTLSLGDGEGEEAESSGSVLERKKAQKKERRPDSGAGTPSRLSFAGGDAGEGQRAKPRKSLLSQTINLPTTSGLGSGEGQGTPGASSSSIYSKEYLSQLKAATPTRAPALAATVDDEQDEDAENGTGLSRIAREKYGSALVEDTTAGIPDTAHIQAAKQRRAAAVESRKHGGSGGAGEEEDYIALGGGKLIVHDGGSGPHPESRLMREDDIIGDEGDEDLADYTEAKDRLYIGRDQNRTAARRMKGDIGEMIEEREAESEDDEETKEWEMAQVRRAGRYEDEVAGKPVKTGYIPIPVPVLRPLPTIAPVQTKLLAAVSELKITRDENEHNLETTSKDLSALEEQERDLRQQVELMETKREWAEEFGGWVEMLGGFLEEKFPLLESIEVDSIDHLHERSEVTIKRRQLDDEDDLSVFLGQVDSTPDDSVDELGRPTNRNAEAGPSSAARRSRRGEREARRLRRRVRLSQPVREDDEGFSTDASLGDADQADYDAAQRRLEQRVQSLLDDVKAEDFRDPERGLAVRFGDWRRRYPEDYDGAFGGLGMVHAWEFWARGEMVGWEPSRSETAIESFRWFSALYAYSRPKASMNGNGHHVDDDDMDLEEEPPLGPDGDLVTVMVDRAVVPLLVKAFEAGAYDLYSAGQTRRTVDLVDVVKELTGKDSRKFNTLLRAILGVFHNQLVALSTTIASLISAASLPPSAFDPASRPALQRYIRRRLKLLRNLLLWKVHAPQEVTEMVNRLVGQVLRPILQLHWGSGGREMGLLVAQIAVPTVAPDLGIFLREGPR